MLRIKKRMAGATLRPKPHRPFYQYLTGDDYLKWHTCVHPTLEQWLGLE
jgi:hypothetical protein